MVLRTFTRFDLEFESVVYDKLHATIASCKSYKVLRPLQSSGLGTSTNAMMLFAAVNESGARLNDNGGLIFSLVRATWDHPDCKVLITEISALT